jgi:hypothetical protein
MYSVRKILIRFLGKIAVRFGNSTSSPKTKFEKRLNVSLTTQILEAAEGSRNLGSALV